MTDAYWLSEERFAPLLPADTRGVGRSAAANTSSLAHPVSVAIPVLTCGGPQKRVEVSAKLIVAQLAEHDSAELADRAAGNRRWREGIVSDWQAHGQLAQFIQNDHGSNGRRENEPLHR